MRVAYLAAVAGATLVVGCGGGDDKHADNYEGEEANVAGVVDTLEEAGHDGDGNRVCQEVFAAPLAENVARESGQSCADEVEENIPEGEYELQIDSLQVDGPTARVSITDQANNQSILEMVKSGDDWRVLRVEPSGGEAPEGSDAE